ncbi:MAG: bifunctional N(6)-L-threonylcarbamoyladenine synthase/serine/threonine protein kinase [Methanobrevibacter sp.]|nr:bifunctional N(6)-L-threonylcarbamoyladenine synthase/serine/threonine protein kinase [Candidatus Methanovirga aequatorialis]
MICLGIEGTAEKTGVGVVDSDGKILAVVGRPMLPEKGGIHPREASEHHGHWIPKLINQVLGESSVGLNEIDLISFSIGPGLGPALRIVATAARALSLGLNVPIVGVNHCVGHVEIGKLDTGAIDPLTLYVSGGNSQLIGFESGKYRIFGETLDIAIGNCLDHFGRETGLKHPAGPTIEKLAKKGSFIDLPYTVKGMDFSFSGLLSAAIRSFKKGIAIEDICYSLQETAFSTLVEVTERGLSNTGKDELMVCGGVAANKRLEEMLSTMAHERCTKFYIPKMKLCGDNGAMIAWLGILTYNNFGPMDLSSTSVIPKYRTDEVDVVWVSSRPTYSKIPEGMLGKGAEANIYSTCWIDKKAIRKDRISKSYRIKELDERLRRKRTKNEAKLLTYIKNLGIKTPVLYNIDLRDKNLVMEHVEATLLKDFLNDLDCAFNSPEYSIKLYYILKSVGETMAILHNGDVVHGDLTSSNIFVDENFKPILIDFGLGKFSNLLEDKATDIMVFKRSLKNVDDFVDKKLFDVFLNGYSIKTKDNIDDLLNKMIEIQKRGRYTA